MDLHILDSSGAEHFQPTKPTYAIRISLDGQTPFKELQNSPWYVKIAEYTFDDNYPGCKQGAVTLTPEMADTLVRDFAQFKDSIGALLVHCGQGKNRSPAVGIALNEGFGLGHDTEELKNRHNRYNRYVYKLVLESYRRLQG